MLAFDSSYKAILNYSPLLSYTVQYSKAAISHPYAEYKVMAEVYRTYPPEVSEEQLEYLKTTVNNWTAQNGLLVRPSPSLVSEDANPNHILSTSAPVTLFPSPFPRTCFEQARSLQTVYNELYAAIASNEEWLESIMKE